MNLGLAYCVGGSRASLGRTAEGGRPYVSGDGSEAQGIHHGDGASAHGENVAENSAYSGGRTLERLDKRRMVVRLDFEGTGPAIANINDAGIFAGALHYATAARGQALQVDAR